MNIMLGDTKLAFPESLDGALTDFNQKIHSAAGPEWERQFKEFLRKEVIWPRPAARNTGLLVPVGTTTVAATKEPIVLSPEVLREQYNIKWRGDNFDTWFLGRTIAPFGGSTLAHNKLTRRSVDGPIITELGGIVAARTEPIEMLHRIQVQKHGEAGPLLVNGYANIFYWEDQARFPEDEQVAYTNEAGEKVVLRAVSADWSSRGEGWFVFAVTVANPNAWFVVNRVFSRDSRLPLAT